MRLRDLILAESYADEEAYGEFLDKLREFCNGPGIKAYRGHERDDINRLFGEWMRPCARDLVLYRGISCRSWDELEDDYENEWEFDFRERDILRETNVVSASAREATARKYMVNDNRALVYAMFAIRAPAGSPVLDAMSYNEAMKEHYVEKAAEENEITDAELDAVFAELPGGGEMDAGERESYFQAYETEIRAQLGKEEVTGAGYWDDLGRSGLENGDYEVILPAGSRFRVIDKQRGECPWAKDPAAQYWRVALELLPAA